MTGSDLIRGKCKAGQQAGLGWAGLGWAAAARRVVTDDPVPPRHRDRLMPNFNHVSLASPRPRSCAPRILINREIAADV